MKKLYKLIIPAAALTFATAAYADTVSATLTNNCDHEIYAQYANSDAKDAPKSTYKIEPEKTQKLVFDEDGYIIIAWGQGAADQISLEGSDIKKDHNGELKGSFSMQQYKNTSYKYCEPDS